jgi:hypothetical protein
VSHHKQGPIDIHLAVAFGVLAVDHWIERQTGRNIKKFVRTTRHDRTTEVRTAGRDAKRTALFRR